VGVLGKGFLEFGQGISIQDWGVGGREEWLTSKKPGTGGVIGERYDFQKQKKGRKSKPSKKTGQMEKR